MRRWGYSTVHFKVQCSISIQKDIYRGIKINNKQHKSCSWKMLVGDICLLTQLILDSGVFIVKQNILSCSEKTLIEIEDCTKNCASPSIMEDH